MNFPRRLYLLQKILLVAMTNQQKHFLFAMRTCSVVRDEACFPSVKMTCDRQKAERGSNSIWETTKETLILHTFPFFKLSRRDLQSDLTLLTGETEWQSHLIFNFNTSPNLMQWMVLLEFNSIDIENMWCRSETSSEMTSVHTRALQV